LPPGKTFVTIGRLVETFCENGDPVTGRLFIYGEQPLPATKPSRQVFWFSKADWERMKFLKNDTLIRFIEEYRNWKWDAGSFSLVKFSTSWKRLKTGAFTDQKQRIEGRLFSLCDF
jgi:hypothetical protein